jgi:hypothetical protein
MPNGQPRTQFARKGIEIELLAETTVIPLFSFFDAVKVFGQRSLILPGSPIDSL